MKTIEIIDENNIKCLGCGKIKGPGDFYKRFGEYPRGPCIECWAKNGSVRHDKDKERVNARRKQLYNTPEGKIKKQQYFITNKDKIYQHRVNRIKTDPVYKLRTKISQIIWVRLKNNNSSKHGESILKYLPYTIQELKDHLESLFEPWMNWDNHGKYNKNWDDNDPLTWKWNVDHIIPQSDLPYISMEDENFKKCWALSNLRPLSAKQNILDGTGRIRHTKHNQVR